MLEDLVKRSTPLPSKSKLLILGAGFSGQKVSSLARRLGNKTICSRRNIEKPGANIVFNSETKEFPKEAALEGITHLLSCIPPSPNGEDPVLTSIGNLLKNLSLEWVGYLSTTGVYGDRKGEWVSENDQPNPSQLRSKRRLSCEEAWLNSGLSVQILRLPGIYGPGRSVLDGILSGNSKMVDKPGQVFSRIHVEDIAGAIIHLINLAAKGNCPKIINIADNLPTSNLEVMHYAASLLKYRLPPIEPFEIAAKRMSPMALSFWKENRKVSNKMLCEELGYSLLHPDYKIGIQDCLKQKDGNV